MQASTQRRIGSRRKASGVSPASRCSIPFLLLGLALISGSPATASTDSDFLDSAVVISQETRNTDARREAMMRASAEERRQAWELSQTRLQEAEAERTALKQQFEKQEQQIAALEERLKQRSGHLGEITGVLREAGSNLRPMIEESLLSAEFPSMAGNLAVGANKHVPSLDELQLHARTLLTALKASGAQSIFKAEIADHSGNIRPVNVTRLGLFNVIDEAGDYLRWDSESQSLQRFTPQPAERIRAQARGFLNGTETSVNIDPLQGGTLALLGRYPSLMDRLHQGGSVAYVIVTLACLGILMAVVLLFRLLKTEKGVRNQLKSIDSPRSDNVLGELLLHVRNAPATKTESLDSGLETDATWELRLDEALLRTQPQLEKGQTFIKLLAAVAPLLGLLGTVVGMIATFQSITLFGTGDPQVMAGGISQALVTTVLGLLAAIPLLFGHNILSTRSRRLLLLIQEKALEAMLIRQATLDQVSLSKRQSLSAARVKGTPSHA